jgi:hypothetical protein
LAAPDDAGPAVPPSAPFTGGMTRVDVAVTNPVVTSSGTTRSALDRDHHSAQSAWRSTRFATDRQVLLRRGRSGDRCIADREVGATTAADPIQTAGTTAAGGVLYQGAVTGILRIVPLK